MRLEDIRKTLQTAGKRPEEEIRISRIEDLTPLNGYDPTKNPKQLQAHRTEASWLLFGGAVGGGKTAWLVNEAILHCTRYPGARAFLARHEKASFMRTTYLSLQEFLPVQFIKRESKNGGFIEFRNGSLLLYGGLGNDYRAIQKLKSLELSLWGVEQAEETTEQFFHMLNSRLRLKVKGLDKYRGLLTANPSAGWVRKRFIENSFDEHDFVPSLPTQNPFLPSGYIERLRETLPDELVQAWIEGDWNSISSEDQLFPFEDIRKAMRRKSPSKGQLIISCDPARYGGDETVIVRKQGNHIEFADIFNKRDTMFTVGRIIKVAKRDKSVPIKIESIGIGGGIADRLKEQGYKVIEIIGSHSAKEGHIYKNKRAEIYFNLKRLLSDLSIPDDEKLRSQMASIRYRMFSDGRVMIESKDEMRKRGLPSPNRLDGLAIACAEEARLTFAEQEALLPFKRSPVQRVLAHLLRINIPNRKLKEAQDKAKASYSKAELEILMKEKIEVIGYTPKIQIQRRRPIPPAQEMEEAFLEGGRHSKIIS